MNSRGMNEDDMLKLLRTEAVKAGGVTAFAKKHKFSGPFISDVLAKRRQLTRRLAQALGYERTMWRIMVFKRK